MDIAAAKKDKQLGYGIGALTNPLHDIIFVDSVNGSNGNDGHDRRRAKATIAAAVAVAEAGDTILCEGSFSEAVTVAVAGLRIIGVGPSTQRAIWTGAADAVCLTINAVEGCLVEGFRFRPPAYTSGTPAAISLVTGSNYTVIRNCRFQGKTGSYYGIKTTGACDNVQILDNEFKYLNNVTTVNGTAVFGTGDCSGWLVQGNRFDSNIINFHVQLRHSMILDNIFFGGGLAAAGTVSATLTTKILDIGGAATGYNVVTRNYMGGLYHADGDLYLAGTGDEWAGNMTADRTHDTQADDPTGITELPPA